MYTCQFTLRGDRVKDILNALTILYCVRVRLPLPWLLDPQLTLMLTSNVGLFRKHKSIPWVSMSDSMMETSLVSAYKIVRRKLSEANKADWLIEFDSIGDPPSISLSKMQIFRKEVLLTESESSITITILICLLTNMNSLQLGRKKNNYRNLWQSLVVKETSRVASIGRLWRVIRGIGGIW